MGGVMKQESTKFSKILYFYVDWLQMSWNVKLEHPNDLFFLGYKMERDRNQVVLVYLGIVSW